MKHKILNAALILTSVIAYLEWGGGNNTFLLNGEIDVIKKLFTDPSKAIHPFTIIPLIGQIILLFTLFQKQPAKWLTFTGMGCIGLLLLFIFFIGLLGGNVKILFSTLPFVITCVLTAFFYWKQQRANK